MEKVYKFNNYPIYNKTKKMFKKCFVLMLQIWLISSQNNGPRLENFQRRFPNPLNDIIRPRPRPFPFPRPEPVPFPRPEPVPEEKPINSLEEYFKKKVYKIKDKEVQKNAPPGFALSSDKAVYRPGEKVLIQVYFFDKFDKKPARIPENLLKSNPKLVLKNAKDEDVLKIKKYSQDESVLMFELTLDKDQPGGFYRLEFSTSYVSYMQTQTIYLLSFGSPSEVLSVNVNKDIITGGDQIIAEFQFKILARAPRPNELLNNEIRIDVVNSFNENVKSLTAKTDEAGNAIASFTLPSKLGKSRTFTISASLDFEGRIVRASKDLKVVNLDDVVIEFSPATGKWVEAFRNKVYFQAFANEDKKSEFVFEKAEVIVKKDNKERSLRKNVSSLKNGMGAFQIKVAKGWKYYLRVKKEGVKRDFFILNGNAYKGSDFGNVLMRINKRILGQGSRLRMAFKKKKGILADSMWLVIQDKTRVIHESEVKFKKSIAKKNLKINSLNLPNGGVLTVQLFRKKSFGKPDQECLIFVFPKTKLRINVRKNESVYAPGSTVQMEMKADSNDDVFWGVVVSDESSFSQIEKKRLPPSLITKIFIENEIFLASKEFPNAHEYIDWYFENGQGKAKRSETKKKIKLLELLLGNQKWRSLFLAGDQIRKIGEDNDSLGKDKKGNFEYLLARRLSDLKPEIRFRRFRGPTMMARAQKFAAPAAFGNNFMEMQMEAAPAILMDAAPAMEMKVFFFVFLIKDDGN